MDNHKFSSALDATNYALAGHATLTLKSLASGGHFSYQIKQKKGQPIWYVEVLNGPDTWEYIGAIRNKAFSITGKSKLPASTKSVVAFRWFVHQVMEKNVIPPELEIRHEGKCGRCGRPLTHPVSIDLGIGPECIKYMGGM